MTPTSGRWLDDLVGEGVVAAPGSSNIKARDALMAAARTSLEDATRDPQRSPGGIIRDTENAVRQAITALAAHHGTRIIGPNKHAAIAGSRKLIPDSMTLRPTGSIRSGSLGTQACTATGTKTPRSSTPPPTPNTSFELARAWSTESPHS